MPTPTTDTPRDRANDGPDIRRRWARLLPAVVLLLGGLLSLVAQTTCLDDPTDPGDWSEAARALAPRLGQEDRLRIAPLWRETPLVHLPELGMRLDRIASPVPEDYLGVERIWILAEADRAGDALAALPFDAEPALRERFDTVELLGVDVPTTSPPMPTWSMREALAGAEIVHLDPKTGAVVERCERFSEREQRWDCGRRDKWMWVGRSLREVGDDPRWCVYAHPPGDGRTLRIRFPDVPMGRRLGLRGGLDLRGARSNRGAPIEMRLQAGEGDEALQAARTYGATEHSWELLEVDTGPLEGTERDVIVELRSATHHDRTFCIDGWVWP